MLAIITVVYRNYDILTDFLASLDAQSMNDFHLFIVDLTETPQEIKAPGYATVLHSHNGGYAHGVNIGVEKAQEDGYNGFCIINSDTVVAHDFAAQATKALQEHPSSVIGAKIYYAPGYEYHKESVPNPDLTVSDLTANSQQLIANSSFTLWYAGGFVDWAHALVHHRGVDQLDPPSRHPELDSGSSRDFGSLYSKVEETDFITGCCMIYDADVVQKVGLWDGSYFLYFEDADYCERAKRRGIKLIYDPHIILWHKNSQSTGGPGSSLHVKYMERNRLRFAMKYAPWRTKVHVVWNYISTLI